MLVVAGYALGMKNPWRQTDAQLERSRDLLADKVKKGIPRMFWSSETDMQNAFAAGDIWIAYAWPADWAAMKAKGLKVRYAHPKEGAISWIGMLMLGKDSPRPQHAHAYVDAWSSRQTGNWLMNNYAYGHSNRLARPQSSRARDGAAHQQPQGAQRADHAYRQVHPEPARLREGLARGEGRG